MSERTTPTERLSTALAGRYRIERHVGAGGMASVYLAQDLKHDRPVALKVLKPELAAVLGAERFVQEIRTTANLQHPHILPLFDSGEADAFLYYVMPFIEGETLRDKLNRETQLGIEEAVRITSEIADALDYAHRHGVIHRDIKPENILIHDGRPMVADFGIALAVSAAAGGRMTETGLSLGTPHYMSPEQATAEKELSPRSDVYSLGCVLYEMLTGEPPHTGASAQAIVMKIVTDEARPVTSLRKTVPPHVAAATGKALQKLAADRFESARAFAEALHDPGFTTATIAGLPTTAVQSVTPRRSPLTLGLAAVAAISTALALWGWIRPPAPVPGPVIRNAVALPLEVSIGNDFGSNLALSPDGRRLVYSSAVDGTSKLWMLERNQLTPEAVRGTELGHQPFFSPDGSRIGFVTWDRAVKIVSLGGEPPTMLVDSGIVRGGGAWGADGYIYLAAGSALETLRRGLVRVPVTGGDFEQVTQIDSARQEIAHYFPVVLPGGQGVVFTIHRERQYDATTAEIAVVDLSTGLHRTLLQGILAQWSNTGHLLVVRGDGALVAAPFDPRRLELTGVATSLLDGVGVEDLATADLALSASGTLVYQPDDGLGSQEWQPVWVSRRGDATPVDPSWTGHFRYPALSPDGTRLGLTVVDAEAQIWIKQLDRGPLSKLTFEGRSNNRPAWYGDGWVAYVSDARGVNLDLFRKRADGSAQAELLLDLPSVIQEVEWSRDGEWAVMRINSQPGGDLVAWRPNVDSTATPLLTSDFDEANPALAPDGRWLAYSSNESGRYEVYVRPFPETSSAKWQVSTDGGTQPLWAHGGRELFYVNGARQLVVATVLPGPAFSVGERTVLFSLVGYGGGDGHRLYDITRDDRRFVMLRSLMADAGESVSLITIDNYTQELLGRLPPE